MRRYIDSINFAGQSDATCIRVSHPRELFLTEGFVLTHNTRGIQLNTTVFAACNKAGRMPPELRSRFVQLYFERYTREEFIEVCNGFLARSENCPPDLATLIGRQVYDYDLGDVRIARKAYQLLKEPTEEEVHSAIAFMRKYAPRETEEPQKRRGGSRLPGI